MLQCPPSPSPFNIAISVVEYNCFGPCLVKSHPGSRCLNLHLILIQVFGGRSWSLTGMLKDRGNKGSWKGSQNPRLKKKSYGNIYTINDRGIHEIFESFGGGGPPGSPSIGGLAGTSAPTSPWASPKMGRKSVVTMAPSIDRKSTLSPFHQ